MQRVLVYFCLVVLGKFAFAPGTRDIYMIDWKIATDICYSSWVNGAILSLDGGLHLNSKL